VKISNLLEATKPEKSKNLKQKALEFQQLILDNNLIHDLDAEIEVVNNNIYVHVTHHEWTDLKFKIDEIIRACNICDDLDYKKSVSDINIGDSPIDALEDAMNYIICEKAGNKCTLDNDRVRYFVARSSDNSNSVAIKIKFKPDPNHDQPSAISDEMIFEWDVASQCFTLKDDDDTYGQRMDFDTIKSMSNFISE
jgi:hypothetical protein